MQLIDVNRLSKKQYRELIESLGGKYSLLDRLKMGGTGVGGLSLRTEDQAELQLKYKNASESVRVSLEQLKSGLLIGLNNTKEVKLIAFKDPHIEWSVLDKVVTKGSRKAIVKLQFQINNNPFVFYTSGWNNKEVFRYLERLKSAFLSP